ncbi:uncharacterized protein ISCGN_022355 [Ixodes scapularis]
MAKRRFASLRFWVLGLAFLLVVINAQTAEPKENWREVISCPNHDYYDAALGKCVSEPKENWREIISCPNHDYYDADLGKCVSIYGPDSTERFQAPISRTPPSIEIAGKPQ